MHARLRHATPRLAAAFLAASLVAPAAANAGDDPSNPHDDVSSVSQYVEDIPTAGGSIPAGGGGGPGNDGGGGSPPSAPAPLEPRVAAEVEKKGGQDASALKELATRPELGAPTRMLPSRPAVERELVAEPSAAGAIGTAATGGGATIGLVLFLLGAVTATVVIAALRRARS